MEKCNGSKTSSSTQTVPWTDFIHFKDVAVMKEYSEAEMILCMPYWARAAGVSLSTRSIQAMYAEVTAAV